LVAGGESTPPQLINALREKEDTKGRVRGIRVERGGAPVLQSHIKKGEPTKGLLTRKKRMSERKEGGSV